MVMDRTWIINRGHRDRIQPKYIEGVEYFLNFAFKNKNKDVELKCPCMNCNMALYLDRDTMWDHLMEYGILNDYDPWEFHGEEPISNRGDGDSDEVLGVGDSSTPDDHMRDDMVPLVHEAMNIKFPTNSENPNSSIGVEQNEESAEIPENVNRLLRSAEEDLYPGCKTFSKLEFMITLLHLKVSHKWSDQSFSMLLSALHRAFGFDKTFPKSSYEAKKYTKDLGLNYVKIDACKNRCILFRKEYADFDACPVCGCSRWKDRTLDKDESDSDGEILHEGSMVPQLVLRHFPITSRLQRMYMSSKLAGNMRWHKESRLDDGILKHPADSMAWKFIDECYPDFAADPRNVRLALSSDGFNPGSQYSSTYSIWPVFLVPYNLPPWMCMKSDNIILSLLIPGPKSPGNDIDVFLQPLIDELKDLWEVGVRTYDAYSTRTFNMRALLLWTISDFPAYANLSGWSTKGALACPNCHKHTKSQWLKHGHKFCYMYSRTFLPLGHKWRNDLKQFGSVEKGKAPTVLNGDEILESLSGFDRVEFGKKDGKRKRGERYLSPQWKKLSVFFQLPYWKHLLIRHNLDVMHVEKNVCENILGTVLDGGKNKDSLNARLDLGILKMHEKLQVKKVGDKYQVPKAPYNLTLAERRKIAGLLSKLTLPDGYSSNISRCFSIDDGKVSGMKSHDCHVFMQDLLVPAFRSAVSDVILEPLAEMSSYFKQLCSRSLTIGLLEQMEKNIVITLCKLERIFIPAFFDVMIHLVLHLASEAKIAGNVRYRWMYGFEMKMKTFKSYVRNKARPEGSIAEAYIADECLTFCSRYLTKTETRYNRSQRNDEPTDLYGFNLSVFPKRGKPLGKKSYKLLSVEEVREAQSYVLKNCPEVDPFWQEYQNIQGHTLDFVSWFEQRIQKLWKQGDHSINEELFSLAKGPMKSVTTYSGYMINGYRYHTNKRQRGKKTQNSGVVVKGGDDSYSRDFYGVLKEVVTLEYDPLIDSRIPVVVLFKCKWFDVFTDGAGIKKDKFGSILVNVTRRLQTNELFCLAAQAHQVFYVETHKEPDWRVVIKTNPRNYFGIENKEEIDEEERSLRSCEDELPSIPKVVEGSDHIPIVRTDLEPDLANINVLGDEGDDEDEEEDEEEGEEEDEDEDEYEYEEEDERGDGEEEDHLC